MTTTTHPAISNRFKNAQVNRTLIHRKLIQPTEIEERKYLQKLQDSAENLDASLSTSISITIPNSSQDLVCQPCISIDGTNRSCSDINMSANQNKHYSDSIHRMQEEEVEIEEDQPPALENDTNPSELHSTSPSHTFVVLADSQLGMSSLNREWETELNYCRMAIDKINALEPRPKFACVCGDLIDMESSFYYNNPNSLKDYTLDECERIQQAQFDDFQKVFSQVHPDIALVCLCGNHDIGNRPTPKSIETFRNAFGDEYLAFWVNGTYNIVLNNVLFTNPDGAPELFLQQLEWLENRLKYAREHRATHIFVFSHHPWFLYDEKEDVGDFVSGHGSSFPKEWEDGSGKFDNAIFPDFYFSVPKVYRDLAMDLFQRFKVTASFSGHFHQNLVSKTSFGMEMIVTGPLSMVFDSSGKPPQNEVNTRGFRVVEVSVKNLDPKLRADDDAQFRHVFVPL